MLYRMRYEKRPNYQQQDPRNQTPLSCVATKKKSDYQFIFIELYFFHFYESYLILYTQQTNSKKSNNAKLVKN